jgi:hypothetical protein
LIDFQAAWGHFHAVVGDVSLELAKTCPGSCGFYAALVLSNGRGLLDLLADETDCPGCLEAVAKPKFL